MSDEQGGVEVSADPEHYTRFVVEPSKDFIIPNNIPYAEGNVIKYICRWREKGGVSDLRKARRYIDFLIEEEERRVK